MSRHAHEFGQYEHIQSQGVTLAGYLSALMLGISLGEKHIIRQVNRTLDQMRKERA